MHNFNVKMIKATIFLLVFSVVVIMISGMKLLENNYYWRNQYFLMHLNYAKNKIAYFNYEHGNLKNWVMSERLEKVSAENFSEKRADSVPILLYHGVIEDPEWEPDGVNIKFANFREHLFALKKAGYQTIKLDEYLAFSKGEKELPPKVFMITFDDGRKDSYYPVDPLLKLLDFSAVMHVITGRSLGAENEDTVFHLSKMELEKMFESGRWEMESHGKDDHGMELIDEGGGRGHFLSNKLWLETEKRLETDAEYKNRIRRDLLGSKKDLEKNLKNSTLAFAYPFGDFGQSTLNFPESRELLVPIASSVFPITFYQAGGSDFPVNYADNKHSLAKRINLDEETSADELLWMMEKTGAKQLDYFDDFSENNGWLSGWGIVKLLQNTLIMGGTKETGSALTFLTGSYLWENYKLEADIRVEGGNAFTLSGRYKDGNNYVSCNYYDNRIVLEQKVSGVDSEKIEDSLPTNINGHEKIKVGISVQENTASCFLDDKEIITGTIEPTLGYGGISFNIWDSLPEKNAYLFINDLRVSKLPE